MLPANVNVFAQGGVGVSWNHLSNVRQVFPTFFAGPASFVLPDTTGTNFAAEIGAGVEYAFTPAFALRVGYNSRWIGRFGSDGVALVTLGGAPTPVAFQPVRSDSARVDEVYGQIVIRLGALFGR
jgi:opacity protein-like surface antigen